MQFLAQRVSASLKVDWGALSEKRHHLGLPSIRLFMKGQALIPALRVRELNVPGF